MKADNICEQNPFVGRLIFYVLVEAIFAYFELTRLLLSVRMRIQPCGSGETIQEQCQLFHQVLITACRARISTLLDLGKVSNLP